MYKTAMTNSMKIAIAGAAGRMGRQLITASVQAGHEVVGGSEAPGGSAIGRDLGSLAGLDPLGVLAAEQVSEAAKGAQIWIDFTVPRVTLDNLKYLSDLGVQVVVIGTTGFSDTEENEIAAAARSLAIVKAGNFSLGVNLLEALVKQTAARLGPDWDIEIQETHHKHKVDAPSGTALMLGRAAALGRAEDLSAVKRAPYDGPDAKRVAGEIGFSVRRSGGVIGDHEVTFGSEMEIVSLRHIALDRAVFAHGAIKAAEWCAGQPAGLYDMTDVLGL